MKISVRYFASVRDKLGAGQEVTWADDAPDRPVTVGDLHEWLIDQSALHADALASCKGLRSACNKVICSAQEPLTDGAEVAFFPPVTGG